MHVVSKNIIKFFKIYVRVKLLYVGPKLIIHIVSEFCSTKYKLLNRKIIRYHTEIEAHCLKKLKD